MEQIYIDRRDCDIFGGVYVWKIQIARFSSFWFFCWSYWNIENCLLNYLFPLTFGVPIDWNDFDKFRQFQGRLHLKYSLKQVVFPSNISTIATDYAVSTIFVVFSLAPPKNLRNYENYSNYVGNRSTYHVGMCFEIAVNFYDIVI